VPGSARTGGAGLLLASGSSLSAGAILATTMIAAMTSSPT
jgi:hypothetical protein